MAAETTFIAEHALSSRLGVALAEARSEAFTFVCPNLLLTPVFDLPVLVDFHRSIAFVLLFQAHLECCLLAALSCRDSLFVYVFSLESFLQLTSSSPSSSVHPVPAIFLCVGEDTKQAQRTTLERAALLQKQVYLLYLCL